MKDKLKQFYKNNKKKCIAAGLLVIACVVYCACGQEIDTDVFVDKICALIGGC